MPPTSTNQVSQWPVSQPGYLPPLPPFRLPQRSSSPRQPLMPTGVAVMAMATGTATAVATAKAMDTATDTTVVAVTAVPLLAALFLVLV